MKRVFLTIAAVIAAFCIQAQESETNLSLIGFYPIVNNAEGTVPPNVVTSLENSVSVALTHQGIALSEGDYIIEIDVTEIEKSLTPTAPARTQLRLMITFKAIDKIEGVVFNSITLSCAALESPESKAYTKAIRNLNLTRSRNFLNFLDVAREKMNEYYITKYGMPEEEEIIEEAEVMIDEPKLEIEPEIEITE